VTWRPLSGADGDGPKELRRSLDVLAGRLGAAPTKVTKSVFDSWDQTVGSDIAENARPISLVDGTLTVVADDTRWVTQLRWLAPKLVDRLAEVSGTRSVRQIEVKLDKGNAAGGAKPSGNSR
jgi:predicted nucleic acid-binding Zn ribbon protein